MIPRSRAALVVWALLAGSATPLVAQTVRLERPYPNIVEVIGGTGAAEWRLRYGSSNLRSGVSALHIVTPDRAYFTHGPWLRLIDTTTGQVVGRWRFPSTIQQVATAGGVQVTFELPPRNAAPAITVPFDPADGTVPEWDVGSLISYRTAEIEAWQQLKRQSGAADPWLAAIPAAASLVPAMRDLVRRDPSAPMLRLALAKLLRDAGDPGAEAAFADVLRAASDDYTEWFRVSAILAQLPSPEFALADAAFDRGMRDFIRRGRDPRLLDTLISRLVLFPPGNLSAASPTTKQWYLDHLYTLAPTSEGTERAWAIHADALERTGDRQADTWRERADRSRRESLFLGITPTQVGHDQIILIAFGAVLAAVLWFMTRAARYGPQRRMRVTAAARSGGGAGLPFGLTYWTVRERVSLLVILLIGWAAIGLSSALQQPLARSYSLPIHAGSMNGYQSFDSYPASPERTLLQAIALQHVGRMDEAEQLYRSLPQFAESWNNLGVLLARAGRNAESAQAFARALEIDPALPEAVLNATGTATTPVTATFRNYAPAGKMIALPHRERVMTAYLGREWMRPFWRIAAGPFGAFAGARAGVAFNERVATPAFVTSSFVLVLVLAAVLLIFLRRADATVPPGRLSGALDWIVPGTSPAWRLAGGPVVILWAVFLLALVLQLSIGSPYLLISFAQPGLMRTFGYQVGLEDINPPLGLLIGALVGLWIANGVLIRLSSRVVRA